MPYTVYVIELDPEVLTKARFRNRNPGYREGKPCVYVGSTAHSPEKRFKQHIDGIRFRYNIYARDFGFRLRPRLYKNYQGYKTRAEGEEAEERRAKSLQKRGYAVWRG